MGKMLKSVNEKKDILIVGTNHSKIVFINSENLTAFDEILLPSIPVSIHTHGTFDENYQLIVQTHDSIVSIKRGETEHKSIISRIVNTMVLFGTMVSLFKSIFVVYQLPLNRTKTSQIVYSSLENKIIFCNFEGEILNTVECQSRIKMLEPFFHSHKQLRAVIAVFGREIRFYDEKHMLDIVKFEKTIDWIKYGTYGKEEETLIVCFKDGTIAVQTFLETANFEHKMEYDSVPI
uniref:BBS1 domain-containing protein n=1 Tax=Caenorhabditis tropicalis TaxID=1561998 RepID=A0A1I7TL86_9PELO